MSRCRIWNCQREAFRTTGTCLLCLTYYKEAKKRCMVGYVPFTDQTDITVGYHHCWLWKGILTPNGYGLFRTKASFVEMAHRASYMHYIGYIPIGMQLDHLCRVRNCVNPTHLEPVTPEENIRRAYAGNASSI